MSENLFGDFDFGNDDDRLQTEVQINDKYDNLAFLNLDSEEESKEQQALDQGKYQGK